MALPSKYIRSPNISHHFHCHHAGQATVISPLDRRQSLLTLLPASTWASPPLPPSPCAPSGTCHSSVQSRCDAFPLRSKAWPHLLYLPSPLSLLQPLGPPCRSSSMPGTLPPQDLCTAPPTSAWKVLQMSARLTLTSFTFAPTSSQGTHPGRPISSCNLHLPLARAPALLIPFPSPLPFSPSPLPSP